MKINHNSNIKSVITGDIIDSTEAGNPEKWLPHLRDVLNKYGKSPKMWEIYRGDSFQLEVKPQEALKAALHIKAAIKSTSNLEVRMAIGMGTVEFKSDVITQNNGSAYVNSGRAFDQLTDKKKTLVFKSDDDDLNLDINMVISLTGALISSWTIPSAQILALIIQEPHISQSQLGLKLGITQPSVSARLRVAHAEEILAVISYFSNRLNR